MERERKWESERERADDAISPRDLFHDPTFAGPCSPDGRSFSEPQSEGRWTGRHDVEQQRDLLHDAGCDMPASVEAAKVALRLLSKSQGASANSGEELGAMNLMPARAAGASTNTIALAEWLQRGGALVVRVPAGGMNAVVARQSRSDK